VGIDRTRPVFETADSVAREGIPVPSARMTHMQSPSRSSVSPPHGSDPDSPHATCAGWIKAAAGGERATVVVSVPDTSARLRVVVREGDYQGSDRFRADRRRTVFRAQRSMRLSLPDSPGVSAAIFPLASKRDRLGVIEVVAPTAMLEERMDVLSALVERSASVLARSSVHADGERSLESTTALLRLASELLWAETATEGVRLTVDACHRHLDIPVAGVLPDRDGWGWFLAVARGVGARKRANLRQGLVAQGGSPKHPMSMPSLRRRFRESSGCRTARAFRAGAAVVLVGDLPPERVDFVEGAASVLQELLPRLGHGGHRSIRPATDELGIAWTAHELKGPLAGARAALDLAWERVTETEDKELLRRVNQELAQLSDLIDPLLRWSSGAENLQRQRADLVHVTRQAVASSAFASDADRVSIVAPDRVHVLADPRHLRSAISNVVRNSLAYAPEGSPVRVQVECDDRLARVLVRDRGPGIPTEEQGSLFSPFSRGRSGERRPGSGLGLFIARRVLEAHGGSISLRTTKAGATFVLELPVESSQLVS
jgi:signal transduction histidine kinase